MEDGGAVTSKDGLCAFVEFPKITRLSRDCIITEKLDTELLALCALVEAGLTATEEQLYTKELNKLYGQGIHPAFATWQQRTRDLAEVLEVTL
jgi:hypothetical protein